MNYLPGNGYISHLGKRKTSSKVPLGDSQEGIMFVMNETIIVHGQHVPVNSHWKSYNLNPRKVMMLASRFKIDLHPGFGI